MDEPTTHLDMASIDALIEALKQRENEGTLIFISHDVYFIRATGNNGAPHQRRKSWHALRGRLRRLLPREIGRGRFSARTGLVAGEQLTDSRPAEASMRRPARPPHSTKSKEQKRREAEERQAVSAARKKAQAHVEQIEREIAELEKASQGNPGENGSSRDLSGSRAEAVRLNRELIEHTQKSWKSSPRIGKTLSADVAALNPKARACAGRGEVDLYNPSHLARQRREEAHRFSGDRMRKLQ